uniref:Uncharacterized protein n=1 Tax=viral metagenome TaxID=1070528 RepID=A0A6M3IY01_9ZZZZ
MTAIEQWFKEHGYQLLETRSDGYGYEGPEGEYLLLSRGDDTEEPFWALYYGEGENPDESGGWDETPRA